MNREETVNKLVEMRQRYTSAYDYIESDEVLVFDMAEAALRGPAPDPETGLVDCGCGGKAKFYVLDDEFYMVGVECGQCHVSTCATCDEEHAASDWNRAMGYKEGTAE